MSRRYRGSWSPAHTEEWERERSLPVIDPTDGYYSPKTQHAIQQVIHRATASNRRPSWPHGTAEAVLGGWYEWGFHQVASDVEFWRRNQVDDKEFWRAGGKSIQWPRPADADVHLYHVMHRSHRCYFCDQPLIDRPTLLETLDALNIPNEEGLYLRDLVANLYAQYPDTLDFYKALYDAPPTFPIENLPRNLHTIELHHGPSTRPADEKRRRGKTGNWSERRDEKLIPLLEDFLIPRVLEKKPDITREKLYANWVRPKARQVYLEPGVWPTHDHCHRRKKHREEGEKRETVR